MANDCDVLIDGKKHQGHTKRQTIGDVDLGVGFKCEDVASMEQRDGRHADGCIQTGYISVIACGCTK